ncbi:MAG: DNA methyltransferase [Acidiferrobacterales bacterium]|nr:DNA methyltransferase [Acidiferrobacterales bacterium]
MKFTDEIANFNQFGSFTQIERDDDVDYFINCYWTARQRQANRIHEVSYRACFKPQLPAFFINRLTQINDVVYDPFMGRGTTPIESALLGRIPYGNDVNPVSIAITEPRINPPDPFSIQKRLTEIPWDSFKDVENQDLLVFYHPDTLAKLEGLRKWLIQRATSGALDPADKWIRMVAINRLTGHSPGFFSVYTMPPNQAVSIKSQHRINERRNQIPPVRDVPLLIWKKSKRLLSQPVVRAANYLLLNERSDHTAQIPDDSVDLVVTSPPFLDIVDYEADNWLRCWFLCIDPHSVDITMVKSIHTWRQFTHRTLLELSRIVKPGGHAAYEVGEVRSAKVHLETEVIAAAEGTGLEVLGVLINQQEFTKTANCWGVDNNRRGTNTNRIVLMRNTR